MACNNKIFGINHKLETKKEKNHVNQKLDETEILQLCRDAELMDLIKRLMPGRFIKPWSWN